MRKITAYTVHEVNEKKHISVIFNTIDDSGEIVEVNGRNEIIVKDANIENVLDTLEKYLNGMMN